MRALLQLIPDTVSGPRLLAWLTQFIPDSLELPAICSCRFLHPGVLDKGNYSMFAAPRPILPGESSSEQDAAAAKGKVKVQLLLKIKASSSLNV